MQDTCWWEIAFERWSWSKRCADSVEWLRCKQIGRCTAIHERWLPWLEHANFSPHANWNIDCPIFIWLWALMAQKHETSITILPSTNLAHCSICGHKILLLDNINQFRSTYKIESMFCRSRVRHVWDLYWVDNALLDTLSSEAEGTSSAPLSWVLHFAELKRALLFANWVTSLVQFVRTNLLTRRL